MSVQMLRSHVFLKPIIPLIYHHHENYDGTGYLDGLSGEDIPIGSRIIAIVDTYFSMIQKGRSEQEARDFLRNRSGARFDPELISIFINKVLEKEAGYG
jgi:response regulator RpfG family c-di-GMP phosphodiesterase